MKRSLFDQISNVASDDDESVDGDDDDGGGAAVGGRTTYQNKNNQKHRDETSFMRFDKLCTLFVDPPCAGLDETCRRLASQFDQVLYVSCNPVTLVKNLEYLCRMHDLVRVAAFDQFPYTHHLEAGVVLQKR